jgi:hypothetical protein
MSDNPERNVNTFRPFFFERSGLAMGKPRYQVGGEWGGRGRVSEVGGGSSELVLVPNPLPDREAYRELLERPREVLERIGRHDSHYRARHRRAPLDFLPSMRFLHVIGDSRFQRAHRLHGSYDPRGEPFRVTLAILEAFPRDALAGGMIPIVVFLPHADDVEAAREGGWPLYGTLLAACRPAGLRCVDAGRAFTERAPEAPVRRLVPGHYSGWGNRLVAEEIAGYLEEEGLLTTEGVEAALAAMGGAARH